MHNKFNLFLFFSAISAREHASTKKQAAQNTSLSLVRQLFHMGVLEAAEPGQVQPKKRKTDEVMTYLLLKGMRDKDFAVSGQFCANIILCIYPYTKMLL